MSTEEVFEILLDGYQIEQAATGSEIDKEVKIADGGSVASRGGAEDADPNGPVAPGETERFRALISE